jgi:hypothetical protein
VFKVYPRRENVLTKKALPLLLLCFLLAGSVAHASVAAVFVNMSNIGPNDFGFNYRADLSGDEALNPTATNGVTCPGAGNTVVQCSPAGTFFTIYDFPGFLSVTSVGIPSGWGFTTQALGITPSSLSGTPDSAASTNVTFFYTGPVVHAGGTTNSFTGFQIQSSFNSTTIGHYTSQSTQDTGSATGLTNQNTGSVTVPQAPQTSGVPEPATATFLGIGVIAISLLSRKLIRP